MQTPPEASNAAVYQWFDRLDRSDLTLRHLGLYTLVVLGQMFDGFGISAIGYALGGIIHTFHLTPAQAGFLASASFYGLVVGAFLIGPLTDRIGRKKGMLLAISIYAVFSLLCAIAPSYSALWWFRAIQGVGLGMEIPVAGTYVAEFMPTRYRGRLLIFSTFFWAGSTVLAGFLAIALVPHYGWRSLFWMGAIPTLLVFAVWAGLPESVRYLVQHRRLDEAHRIVNWLSTVPEAAGATLAGQPVAEATQPVPLGRIFVGKYARLTAGIWMIEFIAGIVLYGLSSWLPTIFLRMGFGQAHSFLFAATITGSGALGSLIGGLLVNTVGFRRALTFGHLLGGVFLMIWAFAHGTTSIILLGAAAALFGVGAGGVAFAYLSQLYPTALRATGVAWGGLWQRGGGIVAPPIIGILIGLNTPPVVFFFFLGVLWVVNAVISWTMTHEVVGKPLEQIARELGV